MPSGLASKVAHIVISALWFTSVLPLLPNGYFWRYITWPTYQTPSNNTTTAMLEPIEVMASNLLYITKDIFGNHHSRAAIAAATIGAAVIKAPACPAAPPVD